MTRKDLTTYKWKQKRLLVLQRDGGECWVAGCNRVANEVDHILPPMFGGDDSLDNLRASCKHHNAKKGNRTGGVFFDSSRQPLPPHLLSLPENEPARTVKRRKHLEY